MRRLSGNSIEGVDDTTFMLLAAIAESIIWSEESYKRFTETGFKAAIELYDAAVQNADFDEVQKDPSNPRNYQIGAVDEKVEQRSTSIEHEVRSLDKNDTSLPVEVQSTTFSNKAQPSKSDPTTAAAQRLTNAWSSVSNLQVLPNNPGQSKTSTPRPENDFQIPQELRAKLEELQIPIDDRVKKAMSNDKPLRVYASHSAPT